MLLELPIPFIFAALPFALYPLRQRGWKFLLAFAAFWVYCLALVNAVLFPLYLPEPGIGFTFASRWEQLSHLYHYHGLNLFPFYFGTCWYLPHLCRIGIIQNILMTIPFGILYPLIHPLPTRRIPLLALLVGFFTELSQLLTMLLIGSNYRSVDINDTIFNALGVLVGYGLLRLGQNFRYFLPSPTKR